MVLLCMITVVSPRLTLLEVVVMVRVTLQEVRSTDSPIANAVSRVNMICLMYFFIVVVFRGSTIIDNYHPFFLYNQKRAALSPRLCRSPYESRHCMALLSKLNAPYSATSLVSPKDCLAAYKKTFRCATLTKNRSALLHFKKHNYTRMSGLISLSIRGPRKF